MDGTEIPAPTPLADDVNATAADKSEATAKKATDSKAKEEKPEAPKRFIPEHKKPDAALTFPEKVC